jgi:hypothetical protein
MLADRKCADGTNINDIEFCQLLGNDSRLTAIDPADVYRAKKNDPLHTLMVAG